MEVTEELWKSKAVQRSTPWARDDKSSLKCRRCKNQIVNETQFLLQTEIAAREPCQVMDSPAVRAPVTGDVWVMTFIGSAWNTYPTLGNFKMLAKLRNKLLELKGRGYPETEQTKVDRISHKEKGWENTHSVGTWGKRPSAKQRVNSGNKSLASPWRLSFNSLWS